MKLYNTVLFNQQKIILKLNERINYLNGKSNRFSTIRLIVFATGLVLSITAYFISKELGWVMTFISLAGFGVTVHLHNKLLHGIRRCYTYMKIKEENLARMNLDWEKIPDPAVNAPPNDISVEKDLDLFGKCSLHNLTDISVSLEGSQLLRKWFTVRKPDESEILKRQCIVKELSGLDIFRDRFLLKSRLISGKFLDSGKIIDWVNNSEKINFSKLLLPLASGVIALYIVLFILDMTGIASSLWISVLIIYFLIYLSQLKKIKNIIEESIGLESQLKKLTSLILCIEKYSFIKYENVNEFVKCFKGNKESAASELSELQRIISKLVIRENPIIGILINILFPYDIFFTQKLIKLRSEIEKNISGWMEKLNEFECYLSLSNFAFINPDYVFPEISTSRNVFEVKSLGHPLIKRESKVCNDFSFSKENEIVIITGSNMSGKSTFLRASGMNLRLAYAGAPVNAAKFRISLYELFTCIKVTDSVIDGISYFYAEVRRLKQLLDELEEDTGPQTFFLIDEIFKGTNNRERLAGSRAYIKRLSELEGTGFISTHDLELVNLESEISSIENYHFKEDIVNGLMEFDYKIHPGPCPTTNALKIMKMSGLPV